MKYSLALIIGAAALLAGCGQPGPLYMPKPPTKPPLPQPAVPPTSPTPAALQ